MRCWVGCAIVAFVVLDLAWRVPRVSTNLMWNPNLGLVFLIATVALAWVVANGSTSWWPLLVFTGSVASQCHLSYIAIAVPLVLLAPIAPRVLRIGWSRSNRWLYGGVLVGVVCWIAPIAQELFGSPGNLSLLVGSQHGGHSSGIGLGFKSLAWAGSLHPIWSTGYPYPWAFSMNRFIALRSELFGVVVYIVLVAITGWAWKTDRMRLASLAGIGVVVSTGVVISFGSVPQQSLTNLGYVVPLLWAVGILVWSIIIWTVFAGIGSYLSRHVQEKTPDFLRGRDLGSERRGTDVATDEDRDLPDGREPRRRTRSLQLPSKITLFRPNDLQRFNSALEKPRFKRTVSAVLLIAVLLVAVLGIRSEAPTPNPTPGFTASEDEALASQLNRAIPSGPFAIEADPAQLALLFDVWGTAYQLSTDGRRVGLPNGRYAQAANLPSPKYGTWPIATVYIKYRKLRVYP
jgi:hypothetical protein